MFAFGTDMVLLNGYDFDHPEKLPGMQGLSFGRIEELVGNRPVGIYMGCPKEGVDMNDPRVSSVAPMCI